jgi:hypothetical protein
MNPGWAFHWVLIQIAGFKGWVLPGFTIRPS